MKNVLDFLAIMLRYKTNFFLNVVFYHFISRPSFVRQSAIIIGTYSNLAIYKNKVVVS